MTAGHISEAPSEVQALSAAGSDASNVVPPHSGIDWQKMLESLNEQGWFIVRSEELQHGPRFTIDQVDTIRKLALGERDEMVEEIQVLYNEGSIAELEGPVVRYRKATEILELVGYQ